MVKRLEYILLLTLLLQIERQNYKVKTFTTVTVGTDDYVEYRRFHSTDLSKLRDKALDTDYVWLTRNGTLLTPGVEYSVLKIEEL